MLCWITSFVSPSVIFSPVFSLQTASKYSYQQMNFSTHFALISSTLLMALTGVRTHSYSVILSRCHLLMTLTGVTYWCHLLVSLTDVTYWYKVLLYLVATCKFGSFILKCLHVAINMHDTGYFLVARYYHTCLYVTFNLVQIHLSEVQKSPSNNHTMIHVWRMYVIIKVSRWTYFNSVFMCASFSNCKVRIIGIKSVMIILLWCILGVHCLC